MVVQKENAASFWPRHATRPQGDLETQATFISSSDHFERVLHSAVAGHGAVLWVTDVVCGGSAWLTNFVGASSSRKRLTSVSRRLVVAYA